MENILHRDLAARNVLLGEAMCPKISDFGLSRLTTSDEYLITGTSLPIRHMAPESFLTRVHTVKSDGEIFIVDRVVDKMISKSLISISSPSRCEENSPAKICNSKIKF